MLIQVFEKDGKKWDKCFCELCLNEYEQLSSVTKRRRGKKIAAGRDICSPCTKQLSLDLLKNNGIKALKSINPEKRKKNASLGGLQTQKNYDPSKGSQGRFTSERWNEKTEEEKITQVTKASKGLHDKLKDPIYSAQHYAKVFAQTKIGYISKGHKDLHSLIEKFGFKSHVQIGSIQVDECNEELKIVIEYNGDFWHCNPKTWKKDDYNNTIRMTAGEKWEKDIARHKFLRSLGYETIVVWEKEWQENAQKYLDRIEEKYNEISKKRNN